MKFIELFESWICIMVAIPMNVFPSRDGAGSVSGFQLCAKVPSMSLKASVGGTSTRPRETFNFFRGT